MCFPSRLARAMPARTRSWIMVRRTPFIRGESPNTGAFGYGNDFFAREFWRFVMVQQYVEKLALTAVDYPPMQDPASFNLDAVKKKVQEMIKHREGQ